MAGYSQKSLSQKLGLKDGLRTHFIEAPTKLESWLDPMPDIQLVRRQPYEFVLLFVNETVLLENWLVKLRTQISQSGMIWVAWYKKSSKKPTQLTEDTIRDTALPLGFVDVRVCAISEEWSGLKLVIRVEERRK